MRLLWTTICQLLKKYGVVENSLRLGSLWMPLLHSPTTLLMQVGIWALLWCRRPWFDPWVRKIPWRKEWLSTLAFLPGEFHGQRSLVGYKPWGCKKLDTTEWLSLSLRLNMASSHRIAIIRRAEVMTTSQLFCWCQASKGKMLSCCIVEICGYAH